MKNLIVLGVLVSLLFSSCSDGVDPSHDETRTIVFNLVPGEGSINVLFNGTDTISRIEFKSQSFYHSLPSGQNSVKVINAQGDVLIEENIEFLPGWYSSVVVYKSSDGQYGIVSNDDIPFTQKHLTGIESAVLADNFMTQYLTASNLPFEEIDIYWGTRSTGTAEGINGPRYLDRRIWLNLSDNLRPFESNTTPVFGYRYERTLDSFAWEDKLYFWNGDSPDIETVFDPPYVFKWGEGVIPEVSKHEIIIPSLSKKRLLDYAFSSKDDYILVIYEDPEAENGYDGILVNVNDIRIFSGF